MDDAGQGALEAVERGRLEALTAINRALLHEAHVLHDHPDLLWQQSHNLMQWESPPIASRLAVERERRNRPSSRPWIHRYSRLIESEALICTLVGHTSDVSHCVVSPDGTWIVSASADKTLKIWHTATGRERATLTGHTDEVLSCAMSPDGTWIVSASADSTLKIWDVSTKAVRATLTGHTETVTSCAVSPDGTWIVSASADKTLRIWDVATRRERAVLFGHTSGIASCAVSPDGTLIVSASADNTLKIWNASTGALRATLVGHTEMVTSCAVSPDGTWIVSTSLDRTLRTWDSGTGCERSTLIIPRASTRLSFSAAFSPDGSRIVLASSDAGLTKLSGFEYDHHEWDSLRILDAATGREQVILSGLGGVNSCAVSPDGTWVVSTSVDNTLKIWDLAAHHQESSPTTRNEAVIGCAVEVGGRRAVSMGSRTVTTWDLATGRELSGLSSASFQGYFMSLSRDGRYILSLGTRDANIGLRDATTGRKRANLSGHSDVVRACAVSPDGRWAVSASDDCTLKIWNVTTGQVRSTLAGHIDWVTDCAVSPDGTWIVSTSKDRTLKVWDVATSAASATMTGHTDAVRGCAICPDGTWVVSASDDGALKIWDISTTRNLASLSGHTDAVGACAISPDGTLIVSSSADRTMKVWNRITLREVTDLILPATGSAVAFHPFLPIVVCGDSAGGFHLSHLSGITLEPLIITATVRDLGYSVRCPACRESFSIERDQLGTETTCPNPTCTTKLRLNTFTLAAPGSGGKRLWFKRGKTR